MATNLEGLIADQDKEMGLPEAMTLFSLFNHKISFTGKLEFTFRTIESRH